MRLREHLRDDVGLGADAAGAIELRFGRLKPSARPYLEVGDRGPGIDPRLTDRIFEPFYRPTGTREPEGGVGLGLALVRQIARRHRGEARYDGGFRVTLAPAPPAR